MILHILALSCAKNDANIQFPQREEFITSPGKYYFKSFRIVIKEMADDSLIYGVFDNANRPIYQQSLVQTFKNSDWFIYVDASENIWFHSKDLSCTSALLKQESANVLFTFNKNVTDKKLIPKEVIGKMDR